MQIEALSIWRVKPYINLDKWEKFYEKDFPLNHYDIYRLENFNLHLFGSKVKWVELSLVDNEYDIHYHIPMSEFEELMYQTQDAPPYQLEPKPYLHGKYITPLSTMDYYDGVWRVEFVEMLEGRDDEAVNGYRLTQGNTVCILDTRFVHNCFVEVEDAGETL